MMALTIDLISETMTDVFAKKLAKCLMSPCIITLSGEIGAGKTTLIRALLQDLGVSGPIKSPTYSLVESYQIHALHASMAQDAKQMIDFHHFDLYRIQTTYELEDIGFRDYLAGNAVCCIEWPERIQQGLDNVDLALVFSFHHAGRRLQIEANSAQGQEMISCLMQGV